MPAILLANHYDAKAYRVLEECVPQGFRLYQLPEATREALLCAVRDADYLVASGRLSIDREVLDAASRLKMVSRAGVGLDTIDVQELAAREVPLYVNSGVNAVSVAEHALLLALACMRRLSLAQNLVEEGVWKAQAIGLGTHELAGKVVCVVGMGAIGQRVAALFEAFGCTVVGCDISEWDRLSDIVRYADIVSLHCPSTELTRGMVDADFINNMKMGAVLVNTARGDLIVERDLLAALESEKIAAAGLDVRSPEPPQQPDLLAACNRVIVTPHIAGVTSESFHAMMAGAVKNIVAFERGDLASIERARWA